MASYRYVNTVNPNVNTFAFVQVDATTFFRFGRLDANDRRFYESVIAGGFIGFFQNGVEVAFVEITGRFEVNGIPVASVPTLDLDSDYTVKFTQARPGESAEATALTEQGIIRFSVAANVQQNVSAQITLDYRVVDAFYTGFDVQFYASANDYDTRRPIPTDDPKHPRNVRILPETPFAAPGHYVHELHFTPTQTGDLFALVTLIEGVESDRDLFQLVDIDGNRLVDIDGNVLVGEASPTYSLIDIDGNSLVDVDGNSLIGFL